MDYGPGTDMRDYKNIKAWQISDELVSEIYSITRKFPNEERYGLSSQLRRSSISVPTNICEGSGRQHKRDYLNFLYTARGSLRETEYFLSLAKRFEYVSKEKYASINKLIKEAQTKLYGLIRSVESEV
jgi:four helix bundle protein